MDKLTEKQEEMVKITALGNCISDSNITLELYNLLMEAEEEIPDEITLWEPYEDFDLEEFQERVKDEEETLRDFYSKMKEAE